MATVRQYLKPRDADFKTSAFPQLTLFQGTNQPIMVLAFDASSKETAYFRFSPLAYGSGNVTVSVEWYADTATSGGVVWEAQLMAVTENTDNVNVEAESFATANTAADTHLGTTGQRPHGIDITVSNLDSLAANDWVWLAFSRLPADASDTMTGDALVTGLRLSYSDA